MSNLGPSFSLVAVTVFACFVVAVVVWLEDDLAVVVEGESAAVDCVTTEGLVGAELAQYMTLNDDWEEAEAGKLSKFHSPSCWQQILIVKLFEQLIAQC